MEVEGEGGGDAPALQVIVLGSGGGPLESNCTAFLVRSIASNWGRGSLVAVDAGVQLSAIARILEDTQPPNLGKSGDCPLPHVLTRGPFAGLELPYAQPSSNAAHIYRTLIDTYLITHPHLDHVAGFIINTAGLPGTRPKRLAGLPSTIAAIKSHIFNNVIWPNLSDENNGAGLVTYMRLVEGGSPALGDGEARGYLEVTDGLAIKTWSVSHGHCIEKHFHRGSSSSSTGGGASNSGMRGSIDASSMGMGSGILTPRTVAHRGSNPNLSGYLPQHNTHGGTSHAQSQYSQPLSGNFAASGGSSAPMARTSSMSMVNQGGDPSVCVYDSSAYSIREVNTGREVMIFGDVEPDSISLYPRNAAVWAEAAAKFAAGKLAAIFIECSYDDSQSVDRLFGHLTPRFLVEEMSVLAQEVVAAREAASAAAAYAAREPRESSEGKKRKRQESEAGSDLVRGRKTIPLQKMQASVGAATAAAAPGASAGSGDDPVSPRTVKPTRRLSGIDAQPLDTPHIATPTSELSIRDSGLAAPTDRPEILSAGVSEVRPLKGLKVVVIHVKEKLNDGRPGGEPILEQLLEYERVTQLGCEYIISYFGQTLSF